MNQLLHIPIYIQQSCPLCIALTTTYVCAEWFVTSTLIVTNFVYVLSTYVLLESV